MTSPTNDAQDRRDQRREERQAEREAVRDERVERDATLALNTTPTPVTALDSLGIERIITHTSDYEPPQVEPDPKEVARLANLQTRLDNQRQERLDKLTAEPKGDTGARVAREALAAEQNLGVASTTGNGPEGSQEAPAAAPDPQVDEAEREERREAAKARREARHGGQGSVPGPEATGDPSKAPATPEKAADKTPEPPAKGDGAKTEEKA